MTERQLRGLFAAWQHRLGLDRWQIEVRIEPTGDPSSRMEITRSTHYEQAVVSVNPWLLGTRPQIPDGVLALEVTDRFIERSIVHELLHCHLAEQRAIMTEGLEGLLHRDVHGAIMERGERAEEQTVDRLAAALVAAWPR